MTTHPHLVPRLKSRAIPLISLSAFVACFRVNFTLTFKVPMESNRFSCEISIEIEYYLPVFEKKKNSQISNFLKNCPMGAEKHRVDGKTDT